MATTEEISLSDLKSTLGQTWFDVSDDEDCFVIDSREHGDVGDETHGAADLEEGRRVLRQIRGRYPLSDFPSSLDVCDEWVSICLDKRPRSEKERSKFLKERATRKLGKVVRDAVEGAIDSKFHHNLSFWVKGDSRLIENARFAVVEITATYGVNVGTRYPRTYLGSSFGECHDILSPALGAIPSDELGLGKWREEAPEMQDVGFGRVLHREGQAIFTSEVSFKKLLETIGDG